MKKAFTLAEVLITLGIIGVIAAMTIPSIISAYKKQVLVNRMKVFSATFSNIYNKSNFDNGMTYGHREGFPAYNADAAMEMFEKYYTPYIDFIDVKKGKRGVFAYLKNGSVAYFIRNAYNGGENWGNTYLIFCVNKKACDEYDEKKSIDKNIDGSTRFVFYVNGTVPSYVFKAMCQNDRDCLINQCKSQIGYEACTALIFIDGWQIKKDYPVKI